VIGATNRPQAIDPALRRPGRLDREIYIGPPDERGRLEILDIHTRAMPVAADFAGLLPEIAAATAGYSGADLVELVRAAGIHAMRRIAGPGLRDVRGAYHARVTGADFTAALAQTMPSALRETWLRVPGARWSDVVGLEYAIMELRQAVVNPLRFPCLAAELDLGAPSGVLISGPPGSGKSLLARALAAECGANFLPVTGPEIFSQWFGRSEAAIRNLFHLARKVAPTVIVIDPLDGLAQPGAGDGPQARVRDQLLAEFDAMPRDNPVIVVGVTQDPANIDQALLRPGRLGLHVPLTLPTAAERRALLRRHVTERWLESDTDGWSAVLDEVSAITEGWSGADLAGLAEAARRLALSDALNGGRGADGSAGSGAAAVLRPEHLKEASRAAGQRRRPHDHSEERDEQER
jgi:transitional endoplasmic reticulum ATPase